MANKMQQIRVCPFNYNVQLNFDKETEQKCVASDNPPVQEIRAEELCVMECN